MRQVKGIVVGLSVLVLLFLCAPAYALDFDFAGNMAYHNDVLQFGFTSAGAGNVTLFSSSWIDGNAGFDPMLGLWDSAGNLIYFQDDGGIVGSTLSNGVPYSHGYWDSYYSAPVGIGNYIVTLSAYANFNNGALLSNGFNYDGQTPIPIASWYEPANGYQTGNYAFHILNVTGASGPGTVVPEPASMSLLGLGLLGLFGTRKRFLKS